MAMDNIDMDFGTEIPPSPPSRDTGNRTFLIAAGILGAVAVFALVCIIVIALIWLPRKRAQDEAQLATVNAQNTQVSMIITQTSRAMLEKAAWTPTASMTPLPVEFTSTPTAVVVIVPTKAPPQVDRTATVAALLTQAAVTTRTVYPTPTALPNTGFAEDVGLPTMLALAGLLIVVIFVARRLRTA